MLDVIKEILISEKKFTETNYKRVQKALVYIENNLIGSDSGICLTVVFLMETRNIITSSNNITLRKVNVKPYGFDKMHMDKELIEDKLYQIIDLFNEKTITSTKVYSILLNKRHPFYDENGATCKILFANDDIIRQNIYTNSNYKQCYQIA